MKRVFFSVFICIFLVSSCGWNEDTAILLGNRPIDPENFSYINRQPVFKPRQRIYYILISEDPIEDIKLRLQVLKLDMKSPLWGIKPAYAIDINRGEKKHYVTDYIVLHEAGNYVIRIFGHSDMEKPIAETEFLVEPL